MPYEAHECLRFHRGVNLTGKLRVLAFAYYNYRINVRACQLLRNHLSTGLVDSLLEIALRPFLLFYGAVFEGAGDLDMLKTKIIPPYEWISRGDEL